MDSRRDWASFSRRSAAADALARIRRPNAALSSPSSTPNRPFPSPTPYRRALQGFLDHGIQLSVQMAWIYPLTGRGACPPVLQPWGGPNLDTHRRLFIYPTPNIALSCANMPDNLSRQEDAVPRPLTVGCLSKEPLPPRPGLVVRNVNRSRSCHDICPSLANPGVTRHFLPLRRDGWDGQPVVQSVMESSSR